MNSSLPYGLTRKDLLRLGASAGLAAIVPAAAGAALPKEAMQAPSFYRFDVGQIQVTMIFDGQSTRPVSSALVPNAPVERVRAALGAVQLSVDTFKAPYTFVAVNTGGKLGLIDTGSDSQYLAGVDAGARSLAGAGINRAAVDVVVLSHFHPDHVYGLTGRDGRPLYPNAEVLMPEAELAMVRDDGMIGRLATEAFRTFATNARVKLAAYGARVRPYKNGDEVLPGVTAMSTPGHSPGHMSFLLASEGRQVLHLVDALTFPALFVRHPHWHFVLDMDGGLAEATRLRVLDQVVAEELLVMGYHFPFPAVGRIASAGEGYEFHPVDWSATL